jgi:hypothetical protein
MGESPNNLLPDLSGRSAAELGVLTLASLDHLHEAISIVDKNLRLRVWNRRFVSNSHFGDDALGACRT